MLATGIRRLGYFYYVPLALLSMLLAACPMPYGPVVYAGADYYRVEPGDTVGRIARTHQQSVYNIARWNHLPNPNAIRPGQVLRITPPDNERWAGAAPPGQAVPVRAVVAPEPAVGVSSAPGEPPQAEQPQASSVPFIWPAHGNILRRFNGGSSRGVDIHNAAGTPVVAAASGVVAYAGSMRGYGNMIIIKHNEDYLSAYAHNSTLLVKENQTVTQGQEIARMGDSDSSEVMLHFEVRYKGRPVNPLSYLPEQR